MESFSVIHEFPSDTDFDLYTYYQIYLTPTSTLNYKGVTVPPPTAGSEVLNLVVSSENQLISSTNIFLIGKKRPEAYHQGPEGQGGVNTDGTWNIRG